MIFVEKGADKTFPAQQLRKRGIDYTLVEDGWRPEDLKKNIIVTTGFNTFVHPCPATKIYRCCNYHVVDVMEGCPFNCTYCILQSYLNHDYIRVFGDMDGIADDIRALAKTGRYRLGTGELSDSLALDSIFGFSEFFVPLINSLDSIQFEFKTKSDKIDNLLNLNPKNIVTSWSMNPQELITLEEHGTAPLAKRLQAAKACQEYGYRTSFHFDPLIYTPDFQTQYRTLIEQMVNTLDESKVEFISISTFRFLPDLADIIRERFDDSVLLRSEYITGLDGKMRYFKPRRMEMLKFVVDTIRSYWKNVYVYFCMEHENTWKSIFGHDPGEREAFETHFPHLKAEL